MVGVVCFQSREALVHRMCLRDSSAEARRGFATVAMGSFHVEVVMSSTVVFHPLSLFVMCMNTLYFPGFHRTFKRGDCANHCGYDLPL